MNRPSLIRRLLRLSLAALAAGAFCAGCARTEKPAQIRGVFLIVVDTVRPDRLSCYGYEGHKTAAIDRLAASGVRFENAQSPASWTIPSMGAILTSRYPTQLGLVESPADTGATFRWREKRKQVRYTLPDGVPTLASLLDDAGFHPVAFVNQPFINAGNGFIRGFAEWCYPPGEDSVAWHDPSAPIPVIEYPPGTDLANADDLLVAELGRWLSKNADRRPFVWLHLLRPHWPYHPLREYLPGDLQDSGAVVQPAVRYAAEVRESDDLVADVLEAIDATVGLKHSLVFFTSDHGEEFFDHGMYEHGHSLHREVLHVPLIMAGPSLPASSTVGATVSTVDLLPTVLEIIGARPSGATQLEGSSLLPVIRGREKDRPIFSEGMLYGSTKTSLINDGYKLLFDAQTSPPFKLFDLTKDPAEKADAAPAQTERVARMRRALAEHHGRLVNDFESLVGPEAVRSSPETQRILRAMRTLGYVGE